MSHIDDGIASFSPYIPRILRLRASRATTELERHIGPDLQYIRINGTLVGGLAGLLIAAATQLAAR